jgi:hypothetical protein
MTKLIEIIIVACHKRKINKLFKERPSVEARLTILSLAKKEQIVEFVNEKNINDDDKRTILNNIENLKSIAQIQKYICNSLLQYEGLGVGVRKDPNE